jgi:lysophospholipase L1-like esterase
MPPVAARPKILRLVLVNVVLVAIGLVVLELAFGNWIRPNRINRLNLVRDRTIHYDASALYPGPNAVTYTRDGFGFRGHYDSPGKIDILTIGGSATDQRFITDGATWQDVIAREFAAEGKQVSVVNAGVDGQSTYGHIKDFDWWFPNVPGLRAKYVLFYIGANDVYKDAGSDYDDLVRDKRATWKTRVRESSAIYHLVRTLQSTYEARRVYGLAHHYEDFSAWEWTTTPLLHDHEAFAARRLQDFRARLVTLAERTRALGSTPVFVTQGFCEYRLRADGTPEGRAKPQPYDGAQINGVDLYYIMEAFGRTTMDVCGEAGGVCIDAANEVAWGAGDFYDAVHNTPQGADRLGRYLHEHLRERF